MLRVGLTGGIGSGKTTVSNMFAKLNVPIIDTDLIARDLIAPFKSAYYAIVGRFGLTITSPDKTINRQKLREIIFNDLDSKEWLENLLHPLIKKNISLKIKSLTESYCIIVIPLLIETQSYDLVDRVLVVETSEENQVKRTIARDQISEINVHKIIKSQANHCQRLKIADDLIYNNEDCAILMEEVKKLHEIYLILGTCMK